MLQNNPLLSDLTAAAMQQFSRKYGMWAKADIVSLLLNGAESPSRQAQLLDAARLAERVLAQVLKSFRRYQRSNRVIKPINRSVPSRADVWANYAVTLIPAITEAHRRLVAVISAIVESGRHAGSKGTVHHAKGAQGSGPGHKNPGRHDRVPS